MTQLKFCEKCNAPTERGLKGQCRECDKKRASLYRLANKERVREQSALRRSLPDPKRDATNKRYRLANKERLREYSTAWARRLRKRRKSERASSAKRVLREASGTLSRGLAQRLYKAQNGRCACCDVPLNNLYHMDHIMPLALGGPNVDSNIQLLTPTCNNQKGAQPPRDFELQRLLEKLLPD